MSHALTTIAPNSCFTGGGKIKTFQKLGQCVRTQNWLLYHRTLAPLFFLFISTDNKKTLFSICHIVNNKMCTTIILMMSTKCIN